MEIICPKSPNSKIIQLSKTDKLKKRDLVVVLKKGQDLQANINGKFYSFNGLYNNKMAGTSLI